MNVHYNPDLLSDEALRRQFVVRHAALDRLKAALGAPSPGHHLVVGPRGMGKTTLLRRLRLAVREEAALAERWVPLSFPEEQYNVSRLADFWANCADALADALEGDGRRAEAEALDRALEEGPGRAFEALSDFCEREGRGLVLLVDNLDLVLGRIGEAEQWELRRLLGATSALVLVGASANLAEESAEYGKPFYEFLLVLSLTALSLGEMRAILRALAEAAGPGAAAAIARVPEGRLRSLHTLTGGNPRTTGLIFELLAQEDHASAESLLNGLLDRVTPLYKARFEALPDQLQVVLDAVALAWDPAPAADIAAHTGLGINLASAQLARLIELGHVEKTRLPGTRRLGFQVAERFFNIWYLMRASRRLRRRLGHLVRFMELLWTPTDRLAVAMRYLRADAELGAAMALAQTSGASAEPLMAAAVARALRGAPGTGEALRITLAEMVEPGPEGLFVQQSIDREAWRRELAFRVAGEQAALAAAGCTADDALQGCLLLRSLSGRELPLDATPELWVQVAKLSRLLRTMWTANLGERPTAALLTAAADPGWAGPSDAVGQRAALLTRPGAWLAVAMIRVLPDAGGREVPLTDVEVAEAAAEAIADSDLAALESLLRVCLTRALTPPLALAAAFESAVPPRWREAALAHVAAGSEPEAARCARAAVAAVPNDGESWELLAASTADGEERRHATRHALRLVPGSLGLRSLALALAIEDDDRVAAGRHAARIHALDATGAAAPAFGRSHWWAAVAMLPTPTLAALLIEGAGSSSPGERGELVTAALLRGLDLAPIRARALRDLSGPDRRRVMKEIDARAASHALIFGVTTPAPERIGLMDELATRTGATNDTLRDVQLQLLAAGGHAADALAWMTAHGLDDTLAPLCHALRIEQAQDRSLLDGLSPEMRAPTERVLADIDQLRVDGGFRAQTDEAVTQGWTDECARIAAEREGAARNPHSPAGADVR